MLTKAAIDHMSRGTGTPRRSLQMFLEERKFTRKGRGLQEAPPVWLGVVEIGTPNPAPYVYNPMAGHAPGKRV